MQLVRVQSSMLNVRLVRAMALHWLRMCQKSAKSAQHGIVLTLSSAVI